VTAVASWLELSEKAWATNVQVFRELAGPGRKLGAVLKGNAYGHGFTTVLPWAHASTDALYVITPQEAQGIRAWEGFTAQPRKPVLVIGPASSAEAVDLAKSDVDLVAADADFVRHVEALRAAKPGKKLRTQVHIDTGLGREGFTVEQLAQGAADFLAQSTDVLELAGALSHFSNTEDVTEQSYAQGQLAAFDQGVALLEARAGLPKNAPRHMAASAAALVLPAARLDVLRAGIALYGQWPSTETRLSARVVLSRVPTLAPVLSWKCPSQVVKWLPAGSYVGYGNTYRCGAATRVAVLPVGYYDGYPRLASGKAHVLVNGKRCPLLGRVMMNHLIADVTHATADEKPLTATLIGADGDETISADALAGWAQTIHYEVLTRLGAHLERRTVP
jgi:alanine racemase